MGTENEYDEYEYDESECFHSINVPSEWGLSNYGCLMPAVHGFPWVSIQLMSPASGDSEFKMAGIYWFRRVSIQLMSPASGDLRFILFCYKFLNLVSIQLMSPASGD